MNIALHLMEPWLIKNQFVKYNLGESGVEDKTVGEIMALTGTSIEEVMNCSFRNNDTHGSYELRSIIASLYENTAPENILVTTSSSEAIFIYFHLRYTPGANVIVPFPAFQTLYEVPRYLGYDVRLLPLKPENQNRIDIDELKAMADDNTKIIVLNNPHNPTGMLMTQTEIDEIVAFAQEKGIEVLSDENYRFMPLDETDLIPSIYRGQSQVVSVGSMLKCTACIGLRVGWIMGDEALIAQCRDFKDYTTHTISNLNDLLAQRILLNWKKIVSGHKPWIQSNVKAFKQLVEAHSDVLGWVEPEAGIVAYPFFTDKRINSQDFAEKLVKETEISILPGEAFETPGFFRIGFGIQAERFNEAMQLFSAFIDSGKWK